MLISTSSKIGIEGYSTKVYILFTINKSVHLYEIQKGHNRYVERVKLIIEFNICKKKLRD